MQEVDIYGYKAANVSHILTFTDTSTNTFINIADYTFSGNVKKSVVSSNVDAALVLTKSDAANGELTISLGSNTTANLNSERYHYSVFGTSNNVTECYLKGIIHISQTVTP